MPPLPASSPTSTPSRTTSQSSKKPIPPEKLDRARELYEKVEYELRRSQFEQQLQELQSQNTMAHEHEGNYLNVPITPLRARSRSTTSRSSRASATSSAELYEDLSQMTSVFSFDDGPEHREHHRNPLQPYERAKAHLVRHLEACPRCRTKKVRCSLDHHDLSSLKRDPEREMTVESAEPHQPSFEPPSLRVEIPSSRSINTGTDRFGYEAMPSNSFEYMGSAPELLHGIGGSYAPHLDLTQSAVEPGPFSNHVPNLQAAPDLQGSPNTFSTSQDTGEIFPDNHVPNEFCLGQRQTTTSQFGVTTHTYICINCTMQFPDLDQCIFHFGAAHFPFNPIASPLRLVCPGASHFFRKYSEIQSCACPGSRSMNAFIYGQMLGPITPNEQPSSAISNNNSYNSSPNSGSSGYNQPFPNYQSPPWPSSGYDFPYGCNNFEGGGGSSGSIGYKFFIVYPPHGSSTCEYQSTYHNADVPSSPTSGIPLSRHYNQTKSNVIPDHQKAKYQANPRDHYYIAKDHWMFRYQPYFRAASIVSFTLSAMFFAFGHAGDSDYLAEKLTATARYIRGIANNGRLAWFAVFAFSCFAIYRFAKHLWGRCGKRRICPASNQCALLKITIPLTRTTLGPASKGTSSYGGGGSFC